MKREDTSNSAISSTVYASHISFFYYSSESKFQYSLVEWAVKIVMNCEEGA